MKMLFAAQSSPAAQFWVPMSGHVTLRMQVAPSGTASGGMPGICNEELPNTSVYHRFLYVLQVY